MSENNQVKVEKTLNARSEDKPNVELTLLVTATDELTADMVSHLVRTGLSVEGGKWLAKYHGESEEAWSGEISATDLHEWFVETAGTRGSAVQDHADAKAKVDLINAGLAALALRFTSGKLDLEKFTALASTENTKLEQAKVTLAAAEVALEEHKKKVAERAAKKAAEEAAAKKK
jgi:hypothetical protein